MDIFESLEQLPVSEACFDEIMDMVEEVIEESNKNALQRVANKRAYKGGYFSYDKEQKGKETEEGKKALSKAKKMMSLLHRRKERLGDAGINWKEVITNFDKGWENNRTGNPETGFNG